MEVPERPDHSIAAPSDSYLPFSIYSVASLNLLAATKAKSTNAYSQARQYTDVGMLLMHTHTHAMLMLTLTHTPLVYLSHTPTIHSLTLTIRHRTTRA
jgi:hypothetical protein